MRKPILFILLFSLSLHSFSQAPVSWSSADMYLAIRKLNVLGSVLYVAAHPDDENTRLISYLSKDKLYRTGYLSITRGDGGQNLIGNEQGIELGMMRTQELLSARRIDGGEQFFTRAFDFGYSKTADETFTKWDKEKILSDVVWVIRSFQPDVIITRFPTTGEGGHGHHTASAVLANEAFTAAADPSRFPEQLAFVKPWQARRVLWNSFNFGGNNTTREDQFKVDVGGYNPLLGKSYGEISAESRSQHKSQGFGVPASRGEVLEYFDGSKGTRPTKDLLEDVETSWSRVAGGAQITNMINQLAADFDLMHPERSVKALVGLYMAINAMPANNWKDQKLKETQLLIEQCSGLWLDAFTSSRFAVQTDSVRLNFSLNNRLGVDATLRNLSVDQLDTAVSQKLERNRNLAFSKTILVSRNKPLTQPHWLKNAMEEGYFNIADQQLRAKPDVDPAYAARFEIVIEGQPFVFRKPVKYRFTDPVRGELYQPLVVIPPYSVKPNPPVVIADKDAKAYDFNLQVTAHATKASINFREDDGPRSYRYNIPKGKTEDIPQQVEIKTSKTKPVEKSKASIVQSSWTTDTYFMDNASGQALFAMNEIEHDHIPTIVYFQPAHLTVQHFDYEIVGKKIGYIVGAGDKVPEALEQMGYEVTLLTEKELARNNLRQFDAILTGVRAYNTNEWLNNYHDKLMKYVEDGGNLIVQYNTSNTIGPVRAKIGPYKFNITRTRITNENAPVNFTRPDHSVLNYPNKISQDDFRGWIQERSIYHATELDPQFETVLSMNDPGEKSDEGSLIIAKHGKGTFVYTGLVFFRELPAGVPGAYRLMANLIALNKQKAF